MAQPAYPSPRPSVHPLQNRRTTSARRSAAFRHSGCPATPAHKVSQSQRQSSSRTPSYAAATATSASRKRSRGDSTVRMISADSRPPASPWVETPQSDIGSTWAIPSMENSAVRSDFASPEPFVNTRYNLAGGLDTPGQARDSYFERQAHDDCEMRRRRWPSNTSPEERIPKPQSRRPSVKDGSPQQQTWGQFVFSVAGKMWSFGSSAFQGFYAGGGKGYEMESRAPAVRLNSESSIWESESETKTTRETERRRERDSTPVPGSFPQDDEDECERRPAKKMHMETGESPWVMVQNPMEDESLRRRTLHIPPPPSRTPAANRRSLIPVSRRASGYNNAAGSPAVQEPYRAASCAHQRSSSDVTPIAKASPLSPEVHKYIADRKREDKQQDASIKRMNQQLQALLKEGREALGTKFEVMDGDDSMELEDEGYFDDTR